MKTNRTFPNLCNRTAQLALAISALVLAPSAVRAGAQVPFRASWDAQIAITPLAPPLVAVSGLGTGHGTHLGAMTAHSIAEVVNLATGEGAASYRFMAANGDEVFVNFIFWAIPTSPTAFSIHGVWEVTDGTGRFDGATGAGTYAGQVEFTGPASAAGHFNLKGSISSPGSLR